MARPRASPQAAIKSCRKWSALGRMHVAYHARSHARRSGPSGGTPGKPVGTVWVAWMSDGRVWSWSDVPAPLERTARRRSTLVAEAAHVVPPIGAQGLNMSLADLTALIAKEHTE